MNQFKITLILAFGAILGSLANAQTFDLASDFSIGNGNPNGVWSYGASVGGTYTPLDSTGTFALGPYWINGGGAAIWKNTSSSRAYGIGAGQISMGADTGTPIARFSAPYTGTFSILLEMGGSTASDSFGYGNVGVPNTGLRIGGVENVSFTYDSSTNVRTWSLSNVALTAGGTLDAYVGTSGNGGNLQTKFSVVGNPVPEPATLAALGLGAVAMLRRRTRRA